LQAQADTISRLEVDLLVQAAAMKDLHIRLEKLEGTQTQDAEAINENIGSLSKRVHASESRHDTLATFVFENVHVTE
jgi:hypothetical protein